MNKYVSSVAELPNSKKLILLIIFVIIIFIIVEYLMVYVNSKPKVEKLSNKNDEDDEDDEDGEDGEEAPKPKISLDVNKLNITLFYADWCGHCKKFIGDTWTELKEKYDNHDQVQLNEVNCTDIKSEIFTPMQNKIEGFPTLIINYLDKLDEIREKEYSGGRSVKHLEEFIEKMLEK
jgi:thiol-disulfide isomerase/thioredoxin